MIGKEYFVRQATILLKFAKTTKDPSVAAGLLQKATDLKSKVDQTGPSPDTSPQKPDGERSA